MAQKQDIINNFFKEKFCRVGTAHHKNLFRRAMPALQNWQRRFWEHRIRDERDFEIHCDYINYNPVKHGLVSAPKDWADSSFEEYVKRGIYSRDWGSMEAVEFPETIGGE